MDKLSGAKQESVQTPTTFIIHQTDGWYFWVEPKYGTTERCGPFDSYNLARLAFEEYKTETTK